MTAAHILVKATDGIRFTYLIECPGRPDCDSRIECEEPHKVEGCDADDGPYDCEGDAPWSGAEGWEFHGVMHVWMEDLGWTAPARHCGAATHPWLADAAADLLWDLPPGRYPVRVSWDEDSFDLDWAEERPGRVRSKSEGEGVTRRHDNTD